MGIIYNGVTVKGRTYNNGDTFTSATSGTWYGSSDGTNGSGTIPSGCTITFVGYQNDYSWQKVHYIVKSSSFNGNYQCWTSDAVFPTASYTISYNANGGNGAPSSQTKVYNTNLTLSSTKPTRSSSTASGYTVTFNANGGSVSPSSHTATNTITYSFKNWNTNSGGTGTSYSPGGTYSANAAATLYAQWATSTTLGSVSLPTPTRDGYIFLGWSTSQSGGTVLSSTTYEPTANTTLYAQWQEIAKDPLIQCKVNGEWITGLVYVKDSSGVWHLVSDITLL